MPHIPRLQASTYAQLSQHVYQDSNINRDDIVNIDNEDWEVREILTEGDYVGVMYRGPEKTGRQIVVAHRGTANLKTLLIDDIYEIYFGNTGAQHKAAYKLTKKAVELATKQKVQLSFTGHSLGAFLAGVSVMFCARSFSYSHARAVTFECPGLKESFDNTLNANHVDGQISINDLDIINYVTYPNIVTTATHQVGSVYQLKTQLDEQSWWDSWRPDWYTRQTHSMDKIVELFTSQTDGPQASLVLDWPMGNQRQVYRNAAQMREGHYEITELNEQHFADENVQQFALDYEAHFKISENLNHHNSQALRHFSPGLRQFLSTFYSILRDITQNETRLAAFKIAWEKAGIPAEILKCLSGFVVVRSPADNFVGVNIPWVILSDNADMNMNYFQEKLEAWFAQKPPSVADLLALGLGNHTDQRINLIAKVIAEGAIVEGNVAGDAIALQLNLPATFTPELRTELTALLELSTKLFDNLVAQVVAPGAHVHQGANVSGRAIGYQINVGGQPAPSVAPLPIQESALKKHL